MPLLHYRDPATGNWVPYDDPTKVDKTGDVMSGELVLPGDPTNIHGAVTKQYVDSRLGTNEVTIANDQPSDGSEIWVDWDEPGNTLNIITQINVSTPSTTWNLNIGRPIGAIRVLDSAGNEVEPGTIQQTGYNVQLTFSAAFSGMALVTG